MREDSGETRKMCNIMIVEDNTVFRTCLHDALHIQFPNLAIIEFPDAVSILEKVRDLAPELIFMDIKLPGQNGIELTKQIKKNHAGIYVVVMTLYDQLEYQEFASKSGADQFVRKDTLTSAHLARFVRSASQR
jgi:DNA-binding NarL/FixJ family response regulator